tara:strand:+ start:72 stop:500 length:429 start_codon:yes stop_codon:yes gene_type:complete
MLLFPLLCVSHALFRGSFAASPRVVPLTLAESASVIYEWTRGVETLSDRVRELETSRRMYEAGEGTRGSIGVVYEGSVHSVALLEKAEDDRIVLCNVCTSPTPRGVDAGSVLLKAVAHAQPDLSLSPALHPRWKIAHAFFSE